MLRATLLLALSATFVFLLGGVSLVGAQETALADLRAAARAAPRDADAQRALGIAMLRAGRFRDAETQLTRASRLRRGSLEGLFDVAQVSFARGDHRAAERACRSLQRASKQAVLTYVCNARADLVWNRSARAFDALEHALAEAPDDYEANFALGEAHRRRAAIDEARQAYERAVRARPSAADPHLGLGRLFAAAGRRDEAIAALRRGIALEPTYPDLQYELGRLVASTEEGRRLLSSAVAGRPDFPEAQVALADAMLEAGQVAEAETAYRAAIRAHDENAPAHSGLGRTLLRREQLEEAERELRRALELVANDAPSALALGDVLVASARFEEAFEQYRHAADLDPRNPAGLLRAARLAVDRRRDVLASGFLDRLLEQHTELAAGLALYGDVMLMRGDRTHAREFYERALRGRGEFDRAATERSLASVR